MMPVLLFQYPHHYSPLEFSFAPPPVLLVLPVLHHHEVVLHRPVGREELQHSIHYSQAVVTDFVVAEQIVAVVVLEHWWQVTPPSQAQDD